MATHSTVYTYSAAHAQRALAALKGTLVNRGVAANEADVTNEQALEFLDELGREMLKSLVLNYERDVAERGLAPIDIG